jgi:uncharacterized membrane protein
MNLFDVIANTINHIHPLLTDFPAALLPVSVGLSLASQRWPNLRQSAWITLILGTAGAILAFVSGDATAEALSAPLQTLVQPHQILAILTTLTFLGLTIWRWQAQRKGKEVIGTLPYTVLSVVGLGLLIVTGMYGGSLVFEQGLGVSVLP